MDYLPFMDYFSYENCLFPEGILSRTLKKIRNYYNDFNLTTIDIIFNRNDADEIDSLAEQLQKLGFEVLAIRYVKILVIYWRNLSKQDLEHAFSSIQKNGYRRTLNILDEWIQPTGTYNAYHFSDIVTHRGKTWVCEINTNVWEPGLFGWSEQVINLSN